MMDFLRYIQLDIMLFFSGACAVLIVYTISLKTISNTRRRALIYMESVASLLLIFDRFAYAYRGDSSHMGYIMVRVSNFAVFMLMIMLMHAFNVYLMGVFLEIDEMARIPKRLIFGEIVAAVGMIMVIVSQFTGLYYTFDASNYYVRAPLFPLSYLFPWLMTALQFTVVIQYRKNMEKLVFIPLVLFMVVPYIASVFQIFLYGLSLNNITLVGLVVVVFFFEIVNINSIEEAKNEAIRANTAKSRFLTNISHEIRTPINTIMGMNEMILREDASEVPDSYHKKIMKYATDVENASSSLLELVNDILDISQIESGEMKLVENEYDSGLFLQDIVDRTKIRAEKKGLKLNIDIDSTIPKILYGDQAKIKQILINLLTNAVKFTDEGEVSFAVKVRTQHADNCLIEFVVEDTGIGFKEDEKERLFNALDELDVLTNADVHESSLGLDISKHFAKLMNGSIEVWSEFGSGTKFTFSVNQRIVDGVSVGKIDDSNRVSRKGPYIPKFIAPDISVLVVDDSPMNLSVITGLLSATKMYITTVTSGADCLKRLEELDYDIVLLDHMMPGMDGIETIGKIRENHPDLPVFALTANYIVNGEEYYKKYGFTGYLPKPVDGETLEKAIREVLPDEYVMDVNPEVVSSNMELPEEFKWLYDVEEINVERGIEYCGGTKNFITSIKLFFEMIEDNVSVIEKAYYDGDVKFFTIKVHALKSSARIIGAERLSEMAKDLEDAGNRNDLRFISNNLKNMISLYKTYETSLSQFALEEMEDESKEVFSEREFEEAINAMKEMSEQMDMDAFEMLISDLQGYQMNDAQKKLIKDVEKALKAFDWDTIDDVLNTYGG